VASLKLDATYAPAFTSLGHYYTKNGDSSRASKCFQKAFEIDVREVDAARMLANKFAEEEAWELLAVVSNRLITEVKEMGGDLWARKGLGIVEMVKIFPDFFLMSCNSSFRLKVLG
jgi:superkiller protein 3